MTDRSIRLIVIFMLLISTLVFAETDIEGNKAPDFTLKNIDGKRVQLKDYLAKGPVLLDFWATWCAPCKQAIPHLEKIYQEYKDQGFTLLLISNDKTRSVGKVKPYIKSQKIEAPVLLDSEEEVLKKFRGNSLPHTVLIAPNGNIHKVWLGYHPGEEVEISKAVSELLVTEGKEE